eukprot:TRINITY_DN17106_c0_g1_i1.p1 TRINITY_DN17106_c0_g1~~TRINITY_DN17106_c0_g1_i1.p1  ORF type:complete len:823 (+),score=190.67 TRINITY_DN17106_c0_g1_i1:95-2563(+)
MAAKKKKKKQAVAAADASGHTEAEAVADVGSPAPAAGKKRPGPPQDVVSKEKAVSGQPAGKKRKAAETASGGKAKQAGADFSSKTDALTVFVGQLPTAATSDGLRNFVKSKGGVRGGITIRLLTDKETGKSRGMAFVQLTSEADVAAALQLDKTTFKGRTITVERTAASGSGVSSKPRGSEVKAARRLFETVVVEWQRQQSQGTIGLQKEDADNRVLELLCTVAETTARQALLEFASLPAKTEVKNRPGLLMTRLRTSFKQEQNAAAPQGVDLLDKFTAWGNTSPPHLEMAAGAVVCRRAKKDDVLEALPEAWRMKHYKGLMRVHPVTNYHPTGKAGADVAKETPMVAIHLATEGAAALSKASASNGVAAVPPELRQMLADGTAEFHYGLRAGSPKCPGEHHQELLPSEPQTAKTAPRFRYIELFAGIGGFRVGLDALGGQCVFASEIDSHARKTYCLNFAERPAGDITQIEAESVPPFDILTAGFPCQPFSIAGNQEGTGDAKGVLFLEVLRLLHAHQPAGFLLENVAQFEKVDKGRVVQTVMRELEAAGYFVTHRVLSSRAVVPQRRLRIYLVGFHKSRGGEQALQNFAWPDWADASDKDMSEYNAASSYSTADGPLPTEKQMGWQTVGEIMEPEDVAFQECELTEVKLASVQRQAQYWSRDLDFYFVNEQGAGRTLIGSYLKFGRADQLVAPVRKASSSKKGELSRPRMYTTRECCRLMGFPDWYKVLKESRTYHELGNAVCPPVVKAIVGCMLKTGAIPDRASESQSGSRGTKKTQAQREEGQDAKGTKTLPPVAKETATSLAKKKLKKKKKNHKTVA